ncbi:hypothetical protein IFM89_009323 [Coptis chinensis]|uniref:Uncharacterized protein n=1 Tax=Coptis chinensis TaxID=261450 RepID=A0A835IKV4_9MAGN|nr:hypothetical protein IFM89_009323 [Coptis chinensis]
MKTDCVGCFDLVNGIEKYRFVQAKSKNNFLVHDVIDLGSGGIRIGLDIGGGSGTFAGMINLEKNVIVVTSTLNVDALFNEFIAARGLFPMFFSLDQRAGGLFWLDNFHCVDEEKKMTLTRVIERFRYKKLKLVVGEKIVSSGESQVYLSVVLQKPVKVQSH